MTLRILDTDIYYEQQGEGAPLLLLHGWGRSAESWLPLVRDFRSSRRVVALDFPGQGNRSPEPPVPWSVTEYAEMTIRLVRALAMEGTDIIAHSFGARVAIVMAAAEPRLMGKLTLTGAAGLIPKPDGHAKKRLCAYRVLRALTDNAVTRAALGEEKLEKLRGALRNRYGSADYKAIRTDVMRATFNRVIRQDLEPFLPKIQAPTLLIFGDRDTATPLWMGQTMQRLIPDAGLVTFSGAGHDAYLERYAEFRAVVRHFLNQ